MQLLQSRKERLKKFRLVRDSRLFTVLYFSVRSSRSSALRYGLPSSMSLKITQEEGAVWQKARKNLSRHPPPLPPRAIIPDVHPSVHLKIKIAVTVRRCISKRSREKIGDCEQSNGIRTLDFCDTRAALATLSRGRKPKMREYQRYKIK